MGYLDDFGGQFPTTDTADARAAGQQAFADAGQWTHAIDDDIFAAPAADQPDTRPLTSRVDLSGTPDVIMEKLQKAKAMAAQAEAAPPKERSFVGKLASAWFRGGERDKLDKVRASVQKLYSENPQDPGAKQAYAAMRAITDIYEQAQAQDPLNAGSKVGQAFLDATYSGPVMAKFALTEGLLIAATDAAAGFLAPATGGTTAVAAAGMTAARLGILGRRLRAARGLVEEGGLVAKAMRMAEPVGKVASVINKGGIARTAAIDFPVAEALFYRQGYAETYDRIIDSTGNPATADAYAKGAGFLSAGIEAAVGPGQLYGFLGGGAANAAAGKFLHRAVDSATKRAIARFGAERVTAFLGEWQEEGAQGGVQSLAVYLATQAQKDPELMGEYLKGVNEQMKDENLVTLAGGATVKNGWDAFATAYESSLRESAPSIAAMASMGIPGNALRERATVRTTKGLEGLATNGRTGALLDATGKTPDELRKQTNDEPDYQRALRTAIGGANETHREIDQEALMVERATRREEAKATDEANAVSLAALHADLKQNDLAIVARADDVPGKDSKDKLNQLKTLLAEVGGGGEEGKKLAESRIAILRQRTQETKAGITELERLKKEEAAPLPDNPINDQPGNVIHDIARKLFKMASDPSIQLTTDEEGIAQSRGAAVGSRLRRLEAQQNKIKDAELAHKQWQDGKDQTVEGFFSGGPGAKLAEAFKSGESKVTGPALREATRGLNALNKDGKWTETEVKRYLEHGTLSATVVEQKRQAAKVIADQKANDDFFAEAERVRVKTQQERHVKGKIVQLYEGYRGVAPKDDEATTRSAFIRVLDLMDKNDQTGEMELPDDIKDFLKDKKISLDEQTRIPRARIDAWAAELRGTAPKADPTKDSQVKDLDAKIALAVKERDHTGNTDAQRANLNTYIASLQKKKALLRNAKPTRAAIPQTVAEALQVVAAGETVVHNNTGMEVFRAAAEGGGATPTLASVYGWRGGIVPEEYVPVINRSGDRGMRVGHYVKGGETYVVIRPLEKQSDSGPVGWKKDENGSAIIMLVPADGFGPHSEWTPETDPGDEHKVIQEKERKERTPARSLKEFVEKFKGADGGARVARDVVDRALKYLDDNSENTDRATVEELWQEIDSIYSESFLSKAERAAKLKLPLENFHKAIDRLIGSQQAAAMGRPERGTLARSGKMRVKKSGEAVVENTPTGQRAVSSNALARFRTLYDRLDAAQSALDEAYKNELPRRAQLTPANQTVKQATKAQKQVPKQLRDDLAAIDAAIKKSGRLRKKSPVYSVMGTAVKDLDRTLKVVLSSGVREVRQSELEALRAKTQAKIDAIEFPKLSVAGLERQVDAIQKEMRDFMADKDLLGKIFGQKVGRRSPYGLAHAALQELKLLKFDPSKVSIEDISLMVMEVLPKHIPESMRKAIGRAAGGFVSARLREVADSGNTASVADIIDAITKGRDEGMSEISAATKPSIVNVVSEEHARDLTNALNDRAIKKLAHRIAGTGEFTAKDVDDAFDRAANAVRPAGLSADGDLNLNEAGLPGEASARNTARQRKQTAEAWNAAREAGKEKLWSILDQAHRGVAISFDQMQESGDAGEAALTETLLGDLPADHVPQQRAAPNWVESQHERNIADAIDALGPIGRETTLAIGREARDAILRNKLRPAIARAVERDNEETTRSLEKNAVGGINIFGADHAEKMEREIEEQIDRAILGLEENHPMVLAAQNQAGFIMRERFQEISHDEIVKAAATGDVESALRSLLVPRQKTTLGPAKADAAAKENQRTFDVRPMEDALDGVRVVNEKKAAHDQLIEKADKLASEYSAATAEQFRAAANQALDVENEARRQQKANKTSNDGLGERRVRDVLKDLEAKIKADVARLTAEGITDPAKVKAAASALQADAVRGTLKANNRMSSLGAQYKKIQAKLVRIAGMINSNPARKAALIRADLALSKSGAKWLHKTVAAAIREVRQDLAALNSPRLRSEDAENSAVYERVMGGGPRSDMGFAQLASATGEMNLLEPIAAGAVSEAEETEARLMGVLNELDEASATPTDPTAMMARLESMNDIDRELDSLEEAIAAHKSMSNALGDVMRNPSKVPTRDDVRRKLLEYAATKALTNNGELLTTVAKLRARLSRIESGETVPSVPNEAVAAPLEAQLTQNRAALGDARSAFAKATTPQEREDAASDVSLLTREGQRLANEIKLERTPGRSVTHLQETAIGGAVTPRVQNEQVQAIAKLRGVTAQTPDVGVAFDDGRLSVEFTREGAGVSSRVVIGALGRARVVINRDASTTQTVSHETLKHIGVATLPNSSLKVLADYLGIKLDKPDAEWIAAAMKEDENLTAPQAERLWREEQIVQAMDRLDEGEITVPRARAVWAHIKHIIAAIGKIFGKNWNPTEPIGALRDIQSGAAMNKTLSGQEMTQAVGGERNQFAGVTGVAGSDAALKMETDGQSREKIWKDTGWWRGNDGDWRFEIDPASLQYKDSFTSMVRGVVAATNTRDRKDKYGAWRKDPIEQRLWRGKLSDILNDGPLFSAYPSLRDLPVAFEWGGQGGGFSGGGGISVGVYMPSLFSRWQPGKDDGGDTLVHEIQHAVQWIESHERGGENQMLTGEVEARLATLRSKMSPEERSAEPPFVTQEKILTKEGRAGLPMKKGVRSGNRAHVSYSFAPPAATAPAKANAPFRMGFEKALALVGKTALADWNAAGKPGRYTDWVQQRGAEIQKLSSATKSKFAEEMTAKVGQGHDLDSTSHLKDTTTPGRYLKNVGNKTRSIWLDTYLPHHRVGMLDPEMGKAHLEKVTAMTRETLNEHNLTMKQLEEIPEAVKKAMGGGALRSQNSVTISIGGRKLTAKYGTMLYIVNQVLAAKEASSAGTKIADSLGSGGFLLSDTDNPKDALKITSDAEANDMLAQIGLTNPEMLEEARRLNAIFGPNGQGKRVKAAWDKRHAGDKEAQDQFKPRDYYMHIVRDVAQGRTAPGANPSDASVGMSRWSFGRNPERASSMKSLRGAVAPIVAVDAYDILTKTSRDAATFMATADFIRDWTGLLNKDTPEGQKFAEAVRRRFANRAMGDDWVNSMKNDVATIGGIANQSDTLTSFVGRGATSIMASAARSFLSSPWVAMKQLASYSNYATHFGFDVVAKATSSPRMNDPEDFDKVLERTGVIRWRGNDHGRPLSNIFEHRSLAGYARQHVGARNFKESWNNLADKGMWFTSEMDKFTARRAIRMAQIMVDKTWSGDKSDAYFQAVADEADRAVIATQVEPTNISRSVLQRNRNPFMMTFTFLRGTRSISASAIMSSAELWIQAQSRYVRALKSGDKAEQVSAHAERASALRLFSKQMIFQGFLQGAIVEAVNKGKWALLGMLGAGAAQPPEDDDEQKNVLDHMVGFMADSAKQVGDLPPGGFLLARAGDAFGGDEYKRRQSQERLATDVAPVLGFPYDFTRWGQDEQKRRKYEREMSTGQDAEGQQLTNAQMDQRAEWMENRAAKQMVGLAEIVGTWMIGAPLVRDVTQIARKTL